MSLSINDLSIVDRVLPEASVVAREQEKRAIVKFFSTPPTSGQSISKHRITKLEENGQTFPLCRKLEVGPDGVLYLLLNKKRLKDKKGSGLTKTVAEAIRFENGGQTISPVARISIRLTKEHAREAAETEIEIRQLLGLYLGTTGVYPSQKQTRIDSGKRVEKVGIYSRNWYEGGELFHAIINGRLSSNQEMDCAEQLVTKLAEIHKKRVALVDIKPENVLAKQKITPTSNPEWGYEDFDMSRKVRGGEDMIISGIGGTPIFIAPEIWKNKSLSLKDAFAADIWSLGITIYFMFTGHDPWNMFEDNIDDLEFKLKRLKNKGIAQILSKARKQGDLPAKIEALLKDMLIIEPRKRLTAEQLQKKHFSNTSAVVEEVPEEKKSDAETLSDSPPDSARSNHDDGISPNLELPLLEEPHHSDCCALI